MLQEAPTSLNSRQIEAFRAVMLLGSMTNAAEMLTISQPAVSRLIRDLEIALGVRLFQRKGNRLVPRPEALVLFKEVDLHYRGMAQIENVARDLRNPAQGTFRVAGTGSLSVSFLPDLVADFLLTRPRIDVVISTMLSTAIVERVALRHFDVGLVQVMMADYPSLRVVPVPALPAVCILHREHPLVRHDVIEPQMLADEPFISLGANSPLRLRTDALFKDRGVARKVVVETTLASSVRRLVARGMGVGIIDPLVARRAVPDDVVSRPFRPIIPFEIAAVVPDHASPPTHVNDFIALIRSRFQHQLKVPI